MVTTGTYQLRQDVLILGAEEISGATAELIDLAEDEFVITVRRGRQSSRVVDHASVVLLEEFREPASVAQAVIAASKKLAEDPRELLSDAYELVSVLVHEMVLVETDAGVHATTERRFEVGDSFAETRILRCVHQVDDTEVYQVELADGGYAALKVAESGSKAAEALQREAAVLAQATGVPPRLQSSGHTENDVYLLLEWIEGRPIAQEAAHLAGDHPALGRLVLALIDAYETIHRSGIIHGDVHANNVLVTADGTVRILDFGFAWRAGDAPAPRAGVAYYFEPEMASALVAGRQPPAATAASDQYGLACLCWLLITGAHTQSFSVVREEMLREIAECLPTSFADRGIHGFGALETVLLTALSKRPDQRYPNITEMGRAARTAVKSDNKTTPPPTAKDGPAWLRHLDLADESSVATDLEPPTASVNYGAAGIAHATLRIAQSTSDGELLSLTHAWLHRARLEIQAAHAFANRELDIGPDTVGEVTPYHCACGIDVVQALASAASGDFVEATSALDRFVSSSTVESPVDPDLTLGSSGTLVAASLLVGLEHGTDIDTSALRTLGRDVASGIWAELSTQPSIADSDTHTHLGIAHGWAGYLYGQLVWSHASGSPVPRGLNERLDELIALSVPDGNGLRWPWFNRFGADHSMTGWCNGTAGHVMLLVRAAQTLGDDRLLDVAARAGTSLTEPARLEHSMCCGHAGIGFALLALYRATNNDHWLDAARIQLGLATRSYSVKARAATRSTVSYSLFKGATGIALLADALTEPLESGMPFFEFEPWLRP